MQRYRSLIVRAFEVASTQVLGLLLSGLTGFLILRTLDKQEYAWFTVVNAVAATLTQLGDSGLSTGLFSTAAKLLHDRAQLSQLVATALQFRMRVVAVAACGTLPWGLWLLRQNNAGWAMASALLLVLLLGGIPSASASVLGTVPRLLAEVRVQQLWLIIGGVLRLLLSILALQLSPRSLSLIAVVTLTQWVQYVLVHGHVAKYLNLKANTVPELKRALKQSLKSLWFPSLFDAYQTQIGILILSLIGISSAVADLGALNRYGIVFGPFSAVITYLAAPAFAKKQHARSLAGIFLSCSACLLTVCVFFTSVAWIWPHPLLTLAGPRYSHMTSELPLLFLVQSAGVFVTLSWSAASSRGWFNLSWTIPPATVCFQLCLLCFCDIQTVSGTLWFMLWSKLPALIIVLIMIWRGLRSWSPKRSVLLASYS